MTGDSGVFTYNNLKSIIDNVQTLDIMQVPHHGSKYNYHTGSHLYDNHVVGIIFASESEEKYPAKEIKNEMVENQGIPIKVSYSEYTEVEIVLKNY